MSIPKTKNKIINGATELAERSFIIMTFINCPGYYDPANNPSEREMIDAYKKEVHDMVMMNANAAAFDAFNIENNRSRVILFSKAIEEYNSENPGVNFAFFLLLDLPVRGVSWNKMDDIYQCYTEIKNKYYATINGELVIATWHGEQLGVRWWKELSDLFKSKGEDIFIYNNFYSDNTQIYNLNKELNDYGISTAYYDFITTNSKLDDKKALHHQLQPLKINVALGLQSSFWATCCSKTNSARYLEFNGYSWIMDYFNNVLNIEPFENFKHSWITIWSDYGEDNFFIPTDNPAPFHRNRNMPIWTHKGFYKLAQYYMTWWSDQKKPETDNEAIYWSYRQHPRGLATRPGDECAEGLYSTTQSMLDTWEDAVDAIFVVTRFKKKAVLEVMLGSKLYKIECEPGIIQHQLNWDTNRGKPDFKVKRNDQVIIHATGLLEITDDPKDLIGEFTRNMHQYADYAETSGSVMVK